jgi:hypothetical protein
MLAFQVLFRLEADELPGMLRSCLPVLQLLTPEILLEPFEQVIATRNALATALSAGFRRLRLAHHLDAADGEVETFHAEAKVIQAGSLSESCSVLLLSADLLCRCASRPTQSVQRSVVAILLKTLIHES